MSKKMLYKIRNEPNMSDRTILIRVEDLISATFGSTKENTVDFKLLHKVFSILARQMRVLEQEVEIKADEYGTSPDGLRSYKDDSSDGRGGDSSGDDYGRKRATFTTADSSDTSKQGIGGKRTAIGSINVVSASEYNSLKLQLQQLQAAAVPPRPKLPQDEQLKKGLAQGTATISEALKSTQLSARVAAAESTVDRLIALLTQLVIMGVIPADILASLGIDVDALKGAGGVGGGRVGAGGAGAGGAAASKRGGIGPTGQLVTDIELTNNMHTLEQELMNKVREMTAKVMDMAEMAAVTVKAAMDKQSIIDSITSRIHELRALTLMYAERLNGFGAGLEMQLNAFEEEMAQLSSDLKAGMERLANPGSVQAAALQDLRNFYEELMADLMQARAEHQFLDEIKTDMVAESERQRMCVLTLLEQKAENAELREGLKEKVDRSALSGLVSDELFENTRSNLEAQMALCHKIFDKQDKKWFQAVQELNMLFGYKAQEVDLYAIRDSATHQLSDLREKLDELYDMLGDPKAAILARQISKDGWCGACVVATLMLPEDPLANVPPRLPAMRGPKAEPCHVKQLDWGPCTKKEPRIHKCFRYIGGSHTVVYGPIKKPQHLQLPPVSTRKYIIMTGSGTRYMMEDICKPCVKCSEPAAGDTVVLQKANTTDLKHNAVAADERPPRDNGEKKGDEKKKSGEIQVHVLHPTLPDDTKRV